MKQMKTAIAAAAALAALVCIGTGASAQPGGGMAAGEGMGKGKGMMDCRKGSGNRMGPGARLDMMTAQLGLTPEQRYKILPILDEEAREMKAVLADQNLTRAQTRAKMIAIHEQCFERMKGILTPEQQKKADEMKAKMVERCKLRQERRGQTVPEAGK